MKKFIMLLLQLKHGQEKRLRQLSMMALIKLEAQVIILELKQQ
jgi:hypothetical protein